MRTGTTRWVDYAWTGLAQVLVLATGLLVYRLASTRLGPQGFSEYALARRTLALLIPVITLGLGVALARQVALEDARHRLAERAAAFVLSLAVICFALLAFLSAAVAFRGFLARLFFGEERYEFLLPPTMVMAAGMAFHMVTYSYYRGRMHFAQANSLDAANYCVLPLMAFTMFGESASRVLWWTGALMLGGSLLAALLILRSERRHLSRAGFRASWKGLLSYGLRRMPGDLAWAALFGLPSTLAAHWVGFREAGLVAFGNTLLTLAVTAVAPISLILLPESTRMLEAGETVRLRKLVFKMLRTSIIVSVLAVFFGELLMGIAIRLYLGPGMEDAAHVLRVVILGVPPCVAYGCLRSVLDAAEHRAINARNLYIAVAHTVILAAGGHAALGGVMPILVAFVAGIHLLGFLTWREARRILARQGDAPRTPAPAA